MGCEAGPPRGAPRPLKRLESPAGRRAFPERSALTKVGRVRGAAAGRGRQVRRGELAGLRGEIWALWPRRPRSLPWPAARALALPGPGGASGELLQGQPPGAGERAARWPGGGWPGSRRAAGGVG